MTDTIITGCGADRIERLQVPNEQFTPSAQI
jgi:hypothetical protein